MTLKQHSSNMYITGLLPIQFKTPREVLYPHEYPVPYVEPLLSSYTGYESIGHFTHLHDSFAELRPALSPHYEARALEYIRICQDRGLCPHRLWHISFQAPRGVVDIPNIAAMALEVSSLGSIGRLKHADCTAQYCVFSSENSTLKKQAHKCYRGDCNIECTFSPKILNQAFKQDKKNTSSGPWWNTAWRTTHDRQNKRFRGLLKISRTSSLCSLADTDYMAISHVWSDGTGVGLKRPGQVNLCLYEYFATIAARLDCTGIWWDAISIPTDRDARSAAISAMLKNFEMAKVTLVHDQDLVNFEWKEDGSPAVAMILSSWFTRGWTAAELWASRFHPVKVLFADPNDPSDRL